MSTGAVAIHFGQIVKAGNPAHTVLIACTYRRVVTHASTAKFDIHKPWPAPWCY